MTPKKYRGYELFTDVSNEKLKSWNRMTTAINVLKDLGKSEMDNYIQRIESIDEKQQVLDTMERVKSIGFSEVRKEVVSAI